MKSINTKEDYTIRKLSIFRVILALCILAGIGYFSLSRIQTWQENKVTNESTPWFAPYTDVTATPLYDFTKLGTKSNVNIILSFIVSSAADACVPTWGNAYSLQKAGEELDLDRRIARLRQLGGEVAISFGGLLNDELAEKCTNNIMLEKAYRTVIERYNVETIDLDLEGNALENDAGLNLRASTLARLQQQIRLDNKNLAIWLTLPVAPTGLTEAGTNAVAIMLKNGVDLAGVNVMTMDYGQSRTPGQSMYDASISALVQTHRQLGILYDQAGIHLNSASLWRKIGATPMIGQNDIVGEIFTLEDAVNLNKFVMDKGIIRLSMWSANRDIQCGENYVNTSVVSDSCSGVKQDVLAYFNTLSHELNGRLQQNEALVTTEDPETTVIADDPKTSPYQIWSEENVYLGDTKVVWHGNVYRAKWWTQGDLPDNPTLQSWQTPWELIGPVLPGETHITQETIPAGTFPEWSGQNHYDAGEIVLFNGLAYRAKWWTQGDSPAALSTNPTSSPWIALTQEQIKEILSSRDLEITGTVEPTPTLE